MTDQKKRRPKGDGSIKQRADGKWEARYEAGPDIYGKRQRPLVVADTEAKLKKALRAAQTDVDKGNYLAKSDMTVSEWMKEYLEVYKKPTIRPTSYGPYCLMVYRWIDDATGKIKLQDAKNHHFQKLLNNFALGGKSKSTINGFCVFLHSAMKKAKANHLINQVPTEDLKIPNTIKKTPPLKYLTMEQQVKLWHVIEGHPYEFLYKLALSTGMRLGEVMGLKWADIDFKKNEIYIHNSRTSILTYDVSTDKMTKQTTFTDSTKTSTSTRVIPMIPECVNALNNQWAKQIEKRKSIHGMNVIEFVCDNGIGKLPNPECVSNGLKYVCKKNDIGSFTFHSLRHTFATRSMDYDINISTIQEMLGHSTPSITHNIYAHLTNDKKLDELKKLSGTLNGERPTSKQQAEIEAEAQTKI